ncbi:MAG: VanW family protein [Patescibacteria group bacterium]|jgi:vancomycin resistance protein YoaR|nr:VanW family protein [Patescibacteria group bacterium]MDQ5961886.1 VanW family protein [Patescibacteria group bacterium]
MVKHSTLEYFRKKSYFKVGVFLVVCLLAGIISLIVLQLKYKDRFYPGIYVGNVYAGGLTEAEVATIFSERIASLEADGLSVYFDMGEEERKITIPVSYTGLTSDTSVEYLTIADWQSTVNEAFTYGRSPSFIKNSAHKISLLFRKKYFIFSNSIQHDAITSLINHEMLPFVEEKIPAQFTFSNNTLSITQEKNGKSVHMDEVLKSLETKIATLDISPSEHSVYDDIPSVVKSDLEQFRGLAEHIAKKMNVVFTYKGQKWKVTSPKFVEWLTLNEQRLISIDPSIFDRYMNGTVAKYINNPRKNSRFQMIEGELVEISKGKSGQAVNAEKVRNDLEKIFNEIQISYLVNPESPDSQTYTKDTTATYDAKSSTFSIPVETIEIEPRVTKETVEKYYINDLVGEVRTSFKGSSADRAHNITIGAGAINGMLIPPGGEFSTVKSIGAVTEKEGYVKETVIKENTTAKEFGGGLCQIATTLFRVALDAGLPITERMNHKFVVHYYDPPGLDATIYGPHPDFRFTNDTEGYLLLQARVEGTEVIMELYGHSDGRTVTISEPKIYNKIPAPPAKYIPTPDLKIGQTKCIESPHDGITTDVLYSILYKDGTKKDKNFHSVYRPWQKVCLVGTQTP